jgi:hypothetical protein
VDDVFNNRGHGYVRNGKRGGESEKVELISGSVSWPREQHAATSPFAVGNRCCLRVSINWF